MPVYHGSYDPSQGLFLPVVLVPRGLSLTDKRTLNAQDVFPGGVVRQFKAQIDTGAQATCITKRAIQHYGLQPHGRTMIYSVSGIEEVNTYVFTVGLLMGAMPNKVGSAATGNFFMFPPMIGAEIFTDEEDDLEVLIGMDVISLGSLHTEPSGFFSFW